MGSTTSDKKSRKMGSEKKDKLIHSMNGQSLLGEVVCFNAKAEDTHKHKDVVDALKQAGLDEKVAREIMPRFAFTRACKKLTEHAVIDVVKDGQEEITFQFTKKALVQESWEFKEDTKLKLNKKTGDITCPKKELQAVAKRLLDEAIEARTTSDITMMVQKLFEKNADLFPLREQGGVYFVPKEHVDFLLKIEKFLGALGGRVSRFPVPAGSTGDASVAVSIKEHFERMLKEHESVIDQFTICTRSDTMQNLGQQIKETRVKIEAYAHYLQNQSGKLIQAVEDAKKKLQTKIESLGEEKENAPPAKNEIFGKAVTAVLKTLGKMDWEFEDAEKVIKHFNCRVAPSTIRGQLWIGSSGNMKWGKPAELSEKEVKQLEKVRKS